MSAIRRSIRLYLADGTSTGLVTAEIVNWTGHVLFGPRSQIDEILTRPEAARTGGYLLVGADTAGTELPKVYIGEGDNVRSRLLAHSRDSEKDFWERTFIITSKDLYLTKAHVRFLESKLLNRIKREGRANLSNGTDPVFERLPEADTSDMENFLEHLEILLPMLDLEFLRPTPQVSAGAVVGATKSEAPLPILGSELSGTEKQALASGIRYSTFGPRTTFVFRDRTRSIKAEAVEIDGQLIILQGSTARAEEQPSLAANVKRYREQLIKAGRMAPAGPPDVLVFTSDVAFSSPSAAAQAIMGTSRNGRTDWVTTHLGKDYTYAAWEEFRLRREEWEEAKMEASFSENRDSDVIK